MDSCTTTVKVRKIMGFKNIRKGLIPLLLWPVLMIASLIIGVRVTPFALLVMLILFFAIIPIYVYLGKLTAPFRGKESFEKKEVIFTVKGEKLYTDKIELEVEWDETDHSVFVDNAYLYKPFKHQKGTVVTRFAGIIEEPFADDFMSFLKENEVEVLDSNSGKRI
jgi:hypothetical protein